jgi:hypothetical protein
MEIKVIIGLVIFLSVLFVFKPKKKVSTIGIRLLKL